MPPLPSPFPRPPTLPSLPSPPPQSEPGWFESVHSMKLHKAAEQLQGTETILVSSKGIFSSHLYAPN